MSSSPQKLSSFLAGQKNSAPMHVLSISHVRKYFKQLPSYFEILSNCLMLIVRIMQNLPFLNEPKWDGRFLQSLLPGVSRGLFSME